MPFDGISKACDEAVLHLANPCAGCLLFGYLFDLFEDFADMKSYPIAYVH